MRTPSRLRRFGSNGQALVEFALILPLTMVLLLGVIEVGYALYDAHVVIKLAREGSNLISRDVGLGDAAKAMRTMSSRPLNFDDGSSRLIFSVIKKGGTTGTSNYGKDVLYQRYEIGSYPAQSALTTKGTGSFDSDYTANNPDADTSLQVTNLPANLVVPGGIVYVTEIYTRHTLITPLDRFGITLPRTLYSIAYF